MATMSIEEANAVLTAPDRCSRWKTSRYAAS